MPVGLSTMKKMMKNKIYVILCLLTLGLFVLITVQEQTHFIEVKPLNGVLYEPEKKPIAIAYMIDGSYQQSLETYLRYNFGFRELFIKSYNQYIWDFYHKTLNYTICIGKDNWLYGLDEVVNYYQSSVYSYTQSCAEMQHKCDLEAQRLYKVQHILDEYGNFIFVSMLPTKTFLYPEYMPENPGLSLEPFHAYQYYPKVFDSLGVNYVNVQEIFQNWKGKVDFPLFPKTGKHWTYIASGYAFDTIERYIEHEGHMNLRNYKMGGKYPDETEYPDNDLEAVLNLWRPIKPNQNYYAMPVLDDDSTAYKPTIIVVGDSFFWNLTRSVPLSYIFSNYYYWYYNSTVHFNPKYDHTSDADILFEILNAKIIDLSYSPEQLYVFSNDFLPKALLYLTHDDSEIDSTLSAIAATVEKENENERMEEARKTLFSAPEHYFPDLATDSVPVTRNSRIPEILAARPF